MEKKKVALITGINGQIGSYLAELLVEKGYETHGIIRRSSSFNTNRLNAVLDKIKLHYGDVTDSLSLSNIISQVQPDEIYNMAAQSHVQVSFETPWYTLQVDGVGVLSILEAVKNHCPKAKLLQCSTSELFGKVQEIPQKETTPFYPRSPYGVAKVYAYWIAVNYRESYNMHVSNGILFNHESPRRGENFVTRKITYSLVKIKRGEMDKLYLGNLNSKRDWGYAKDYVEGMWRMLQQEKPDDYILATGENHTVREFIEEACKLLDFDLVWEGSGLDEKGIDRKTGKTIIEIKSKYFRPAEVDVLIGDYSKAKEKLRWEPKVKFNELVKIMVEAELNGDVIR